MDEKTYKAKRKYAGEKKPSMLRRFAKNDYSSRNIYMITITTHNRVPWFGQVVGSTKAAEGTPGYPYIELSPLGEAVKREWFGIPNYYPQIRVIELQMMPDHLHGILFVTRPLPRPLGQVISGFKAGCNRAFRSIILHEGQEQGEGKTGSSPGKAGTDATPTTGSLFSPASSVAGSPVVPAGVPVGVPAGVPAGVPGVSAAVSAGVPGVSAAVPAGVPGVSAGVSAGVASASALPKPVSAPASSPVIRTALLWNRGYNDRILYGKGQLQRWLAYLRDNPYRLLLKRENRDLFRVQFDLHYGPYTFSAIGNRFLLSHPAKLQLQCSRSLTEQQIEQRRQQFLKAAAQGAVVVSPAISKGEKIIMRSLLDGGYPLILLQENGFTYLSKPVGTQFMQACAYGKLLILAPWQHHNERLTIRRNQCMALNEMARHIAEK